MFPRSSDPFYVVSYYIKWVTTSWTHGITLVYSSSVHLRLFHHWTTALRSNHLNTWYLYWMVAQIALRTHEGKLLFSDTKSTICDRSHSNRMPCTDHVTKILLKCAPISELTTYKYSLCRTIVLYKSSSSSRGVLNPNSIGLKQSLIGSGAIYTMYLFLIKTGKYVLSKRCNHNANTVTLYHSPLKGGS